MSSAVRGSQPLDITHTFNNSQCVTELDAAHQRERERLELTHKQHPPWLCLRKIAPPKIPANARRRRSCVSFYIRGPNHLYLKSPKSKSLDPYSFNLAGINFNNPDASSDEFLPESVGEASDRRLGSAVDAAAGVRLSASNASEIDDVSLSTVWPLLEDR